MKLATFIFMVLLSVLVGCGRTTVTKSIEEDKNPPLPDSDNSENKTLTIEPSGSKRPWHLKYSESILQGLNESSLDLLLTTQLDESDLLKFNCPNFNTFSIEDRKVFWVLVLSAIAEPESGYNPNDAYKESNGTISSGLLQIDYAAANAHASRDLGHVFTPKEMFDPHLNLIAGLFVMRNQIKLFGTIFTTKNYYWSVLTRKQPRIREVFEKNSWQLPQCNNELN